jgi:hypothetical protein
VYGSRDLGAPWRESGARLVLAIENSADQERGLAMLKTLNGRFGDSRYPAFLKLLLIVAESKNTEAKRRLADAIALGLRRGDAPSGVLTSWGATRYWSAREPLRAGMLPGGGEGSGDNWLVAIAKAMGNALGRLSAKLVDESRQLDHLAGHTSSGGAQKFRSTMAKFQADAQTLGMLSDAFSNAIKSIGQGMQTMASKQ